MQKCHEDVIPMSGSCHGSLTVTFHVCMSCVCQGWAECCVIECHGEGTVTEAWVVMRVLS